MESGPASPISPDDPAKGLAVAGRVTVPHPKRDLPLGTLRSIEKLALHVAGMLEDHDPIPEPSTLDTIMNDPKNADAVGMVVDAPVRPARSVRVNVMLPEDVLRAIDQRTRNRSRFLTDAAKSKLHEMA